MVIFVVRTLESQSPWKRDCKFSYRDIPEDIMKKWMETNILKGKEEC